MSNNVLPIVVMIDPSAPAPSGNITVTVIVNEPPTDGSQAVSITGSPSGYFTGLPGSIDILQGTDRTSFSASLSNSASGTGTISASCNGTTVNGSCTATVG